MKLLLFSVLVVSILIALPSCKSACEKNHTGTFDVINSDANPYNVVLDSYAPIYLNNGDHYPFAFTTGVTHTVVSTQAAGYLIYPTVYSYTISNTYADCRTYSYQIP